MAGEVRTVKEGSLWWVRQSGLGTAWATASAPPSGLMGFVRSFTYTSGATFAPISDRGELNHWKKTDVTPISMTVSFAWTGAWPSGISGSGASVPMLALEHRAITPEVAGGTSAGSGVYHQFYGVIIDSLQFTEGAENVVQATIRALGMSANGASGYLA